MIKLLQIQVSGGKIFIDRESEDFDNCDFYNTEFSIIGDTKLPIFISCSFKGGNASTLDRSLFSNCYFEPEK